MSTINLGNKTVGKNHPTYIIAEIGINHQGDVEIAKKLISKAAEAGADAVKFQKRSVNRILTEEGLKMPYDNPNSFGKTYGEHKVALELSESDYAELLAYATAENVSLLASGWDEESVDFLDDLGVSFFKKASADLTNFPLLEHTAKKNKPIILSTGMSDLDTVKKAYDLVSEFNDQIAILQCTSSYPSKYDEIHLNVISTYKELFPKAVIGYSGHELGISVSTAAVALGAHIVERHFTLDRTMKGGDHAASLEPSGFQKMVRDIRNIEKAMGSNEKTVQESEIKVFTKLAKSLVTAQDINPGTIITREMLTTKGPGTGISPMDLDKVLGKKVTVQLNKDVIIKETDIEW
jgi:sialic acid synthase SpsE